MSIDSKVSIGLRHSVLEFQVVTDFTVTTKYVFLVKMQRIINELAFSVIDDKIPDFKI